MSQNYESGFSYFAHHKPSGEDWYILGIDVKGDRVCTAGYPPTIAKLSDCEDVEKNEPLTAEELKYRKSKYGENWL